MKTFAAVITGIHLNTQVVTLSAESKEDAFFRAEILADQLRDEGKFEECGMLDYDVFELEDAPHVSEGKKSEPDDDTACLKTIAELIRFSRDTDGELSDKVLARLFLDGMYACAED